jgi:hypothetical protein
MIRITMPLQCNRFCGDVGCWEEKNRERARKFRRFGCWIFTAPIFVFFFTSVQVVTESASKTTERYNNWDNDYCMLECYKFCKVCFNCPLHLVLDVDKIFITTHTSTIFPIIISIISGVWNMCDVNATWNKHSDWSASAPCTIEKFFSPEPS